MSTFREARKILGKLGFHLYHPSDSSGKSIEGKCSTGFDYLGCNISLGFVHPSKESRTGLLEKIKHLLAESLFEMRIISSKGSNPDNGSMVKTLEAMSHTIRAWGNQYSYCNANQIWNNLDIEVSKLIGIYLKECERIYLGCGPVDRRRVLGVWLMRDCKSDPIFPLRKSETSNPV